MQYVYGPKENEHDHDLPKPVELLDEDFDGESLGLITQEALDDILGDL